MLKVNGIDTLAFRFMNRTVAVPHHMVVNTFSLLAIGLLSGRFNESVFEALSTGGAVASVSTDDHDSVSPDVFAADPDATDTLFSHLENFEEIQEAIRENVEKQGRTWE